MNGEQHLSDTLTPRELEILRLVALGLSNRDIAEDLVVAPETVRWYTKQIYSKLGVHGRVPALVRAQKLGLLAEQSASATDTPPSQHLPVHNLPVPLTPLIGRSGAIAEVKHLLQGSRLLTLTGVGGTGKTRLALQVASAVIDDFADGVYFVDLAPVTDPALVAKAVAAALGIIENPHESLADTLYRVLGKRGLLLVMDNFEHVLDAAWLVSGLLAATLRMKVLVTSREALHLSGEQEYPVPPLSLPSAEVVSIQDVTASEAGSLFVQRVQMKLPRFAINADNAPAVAQICARLDGLPLAIELAAARCKVLAPRALLDRLDSRLTALAGGSRDAPARQQTLRETIDWSFNLLDEDEKTLFARLAVFRGGRSLEAIEAVCGQNLSIDVLDGLTSLVDKSLVQQKATLGGEPRFVMLETIQEYAGERLEASRETEAIRRHHAEYFTNLAERAEPELRLAHQKHWFQLLDIEQENMRAVLVWSLGGGDVTFGVRLAGALYLLWYAYGHHVGGLRWTKALLQRLDETPIHYHPKFLISAGHMEMMHNLEAANNLFIQALRISRELGDVQHTAWALAFYSYTLVNDIKTATSVAEQSLALFRELDHKPGIAQALNIIGEIARIGGDVDRAKRTYKECLAISQQTGESRRVYFMTENLAFLALHEGDHERAMALQLEAIEMARETDNRLDLASALAFLAGSVAASGQLKRAAQLLGTSESALDGMGARHQPSDKTEVDRIIALVRAQLAGSTFQTEWAQGQAMSLEQAVAYVLDEFGSGDKD